MCEECPIDADFDVIDLSTAQDRINFLVNLDDDGDADDVQLRELEELRNLVQFIKLHGHTEATRSDHVTDLLKERDTGEFESFIDWDRATEYAIDASCEFDGETYCVWSF